MKTRIITLFVIAFIALQDFAAQPTLPGDSGGGGNVDDVPIQFLLYPLLLLGAYLGYRKLNNKK